MISDRPARLSGPWDSYLCASCASRHFHETWPELSRMVTKSLSLVSDWMTRMSSARSRLGMTSRRRRWSWEKRAFSSKASLQLSYSICFQTDSLAASASPSAAGAAAAAAGMVRGFSGEEGEGGLSQRSRSEVEKGSAGHSAGRGLVCAVRATLTRCVTAARDRADCELITRCYSQ